MSIIGVPQGCRQGRHVVASEVSWKQSAFRSLVRVRHTHNIAFTAGEVTKTYVNWQADEPQREWSALQCLAAYAPDLAPTPLSTGTQNGRPYIVMARVPGTPLTHALTDAQQSALTDALRRLFAVPVPDGLPVRANDLLTFQARLIPQLLDPQNLGVCRDMATVEHAIDTAVPWLQAHPPNEAWIVDAVLARGDGNLDNVIWDGQTARLVDWEEFGVSDLAYEVADVIEHASARLERRLDIPTFLSSLTLSGEQRDRLDRFRRVFACFWLTMLLPGRPAWRRNPPGSTEDQARHVIELLA